MTLDDLVLLKGFFWDVATNPGWVYRFHHDGGDEVEGADELVIFCSDEATCSIGNGVITWTQNAEAWFNSICLVDGLLNGVYLDRSESGHQYMYVTRDVEVQLRYGDILPQLTN